MKTSNAVSSFRTETLLYVFHNNEHNALTPAYPTKEALKVNLRSVYGENADWVTFTTGLIDRLWLDSESINFRKNKSKQIAALEHFANCKVGEGHGITKKDFTELLKGADENLGLTYNALRLFVLSSTRKSPDLPDKISEAIKLEKIVEIVCKHNDMIDSYHKLAVVCFGKEHGFIQHQNDTDDNKRIQLASFIETKSQNGYFAAAAFYGLDLKLELAVRLSNVLDAFHIFYRHFRVPAGFYTDFSDICILTNPVDIVREIMLFVGKTTPAMDG